MSIPTMHVPGGRVHVLDGRQTDDFGIVGYLCGIAIRFDDRATGEPPTCGNCLRVLKRRTPTESKDGEQ